MCCVHPVAILNVAFCITCSLLILVEDTRCDHMKEANSRAGFMTVLKVVMKCLLLFAPSCCCECFLSFVVACVRVHRCCECVYCMGVFRSNVRPKTFECVAGFGCFKDQNRIVYSSGSGVNRVQVVLSGFSVRLFCFVQTKTLCRYGWYVFLGCTHACVYRCHLRRP